MWSFRWHRRLVATACFALAGTALTLQLIAAERLVAALSVIEPRRGPAVLARPRPPGLRAFGVGLTSSERGVWGGDGSGPAAGAWWRGGPYRVGQPLLAAAPPCPHGSVVLIATFDDPSCSFAAFRAGGEQPRLRRAGEQIGGYTVQAITWDRAWLASSTGPCMMRLGEPPAPAATSAAAGADRPVEPEQRAAAMIQRLGPGQYAVDRALLAAVAREPRAWVGRTRVRIVRRDGRAAGVQLLGVRPGSVPALLGLESGDVLQSVNGFALGEPTAMLEAYRALQSADRLALRLQRDGALATIRIVFR